MNKIKKDEQARVLFISRGEENLGVEYLSSFLKSKNIMTRLFYDPGFDDIFFIKLGRSDKKIRKLEKLIKEFKPHLIAFTSVTLTFASIRDLADHIKESFGIPTVLGGVHATTLQEKIFEMGCFDYLCIGEGEHALLELVMAVMGKRDFDIPNIWYKRGTETVKNPLAPLYRDLDDLPFPDKDMYYNEKVFSTRYTIMTSRGCPFKCTYCINDLYHRLYKGQPVVRRRSVDNVIEELLCFKDRYKIKKIRFYDDVFTVNKRWLEDFCSKYSSKIRIPFQCNISPTSTDPDTLKMLKESGCRAVSMGVQSGSSRIRENIMGRKMDNADIVYAAELVHRAGIKLLTELIFAVPTETEEEMWQTVKLNKSLKPNNTASFNFYPFPGVKLTEESLKLGLLDEGGFRNVMLGKKGFNTWNKISLLSHPYKKQANAIKQLIPIFSILPEKFLPLMKLFTKKGFRWVPRMLFFAGYPLFDTDEFIIKLKDYIRYIIYKLR